MSLRTSRRSQAAAASAAGEEVPSVPISEIRARKWTKQVKNVGHITIVKWVPEQEHPTEALQRGGFKKTKGRKRPMAEVGRMTRSVRQHLDAPLELLVEMPAVRQSTRATAGLGIVPTPHSAPVATAAPPVTTAPSADGAAAAAVALAPVAVAPATAAAAPPPAMPSVASAESLLGMSGDSMMFSEGVASEEQLERELDDLPFLDSDNLAMDPALAMDRHEAPTQPPSAAPAAMAAAPSAPQPVAPSAVPEPTAASSAPAAPVAQPSPDASASAASAEDDGASSSSSSSDDDDDDDDGNETASVDSATPQQSPSPTMMSRSPSP